MYPLVYKVGYIQKVEDNYNTEILPQNEVSESHSKLPSLGTLHQKVEPSESLALKAYGAYFQESQKAVGKRLHS